MTLLNLILVKAYKAAEQNVLHDREFLNHFSCVHFNQTAVYFRPRWHIAYIPELIGMFGERTLLNLFKT